MKVEHEIEGVNYTLMHDHSKTMGESWSEKLGRNFLTSEYMSNLMFFIDQLYNSTETLRPARQSDVFNSLRQTKFEDIKVVIFDSEPTGLLSNGMAFGEYGQNTKDGIKNPKLKLIYQNLVGNDSENEYFDKSLLSWTRQGVLLLNTSLVSCKEYENKYSLYFRNFIREIIKKLDEKVGIVFCFTDDSQSKHFKRYIDKDFHHILEYPIIDVNCPIFERINELLIKEKEEAIVW
jgi:uracil-DNA glycosylase